MTEKLYYKDQYIKEFTAKVISCEKKDKNYEVILDKSAFFPEGGGQPGDRGLIGEAKVLDTQEKNGEQIHICDKEVSGECECRLDWDNRFLNMQQHSGEHILSGFLHLMTGFDNVGFHMGENEMTVDFNGPVSKEQLAVVEKQTNDLIYKNTPIEILYPTTEELKNYEYRSKKELTGQVRLVKVESGDLCACCGTHVARTGEIGLVKIVSSMNYKQGVRLTIRAGQKALDDYIEKNESVAKISASLCAKTNEVYDAVEKLKEKLNESRIALNEAKKELFAVKCETVTEEIPFIIDGSGSADDARMLADKLADKLKIAYAFSGNDESGYKYAVCSRTEDVRSVGKELNTALNGRGGGKPEIIMGSLNTTSEEIKAYFKK